MFLSTFCFSEAFLFLILERFPLEKREQSVPFFFCIPFDEIGTCFHTKLEQNDHLLLKGGSNCSEFRIQSGTNCSLMVDLGTIVPKTCSF